MFSILVAGEADAWETEHSMKTPAERFKEFSGPEADGISLTDPKSLKALQAVDTLLMYETGVKCDNSGVVRVGKLVKIRPGGWNITFHFKETGRFPREVAIKHARLLGLDSSEFGRTHWAIKDGTIHKRIQEEITAAHGKYDVALSFAGEDRVYVEAVARYLKEQNVEPFYDGFETVSIWGKDLIEHFDWVYRLGAKYCVMFISEHYGRKMWTRHERRSALAAALEHHREYILPVRFDDTQLPGLPPTIAYIDLENIQPEELGEMILRKLGR